MFELRPMKWIGIVELLDAPDTFSTIKSVVLPGLATLFSIYCSFVGLDKSILTYFTV
jgi:hypothetical protein